MAAVNTSLSVGSWCEHRGNKKGREKITSRWVVTEKYKHDGQKDEYNARVVVRGFQEKIDLQTDSLTALKA